MRIHHKKFIHHEGNEEKDYKINSLILQVTSCSSWLFHNIEYFHGLSSVGMHINQGKDEWVLIRYLLGSNGFEAMALLGPA